VRGPRVVESSMSARRVETTSIEALETDKDALRGVLSSEADKLQKTSALYENSPDHQSTMYIPL
jgi:hypothetical protein